MKVVCRLPFDSKAAERSRNRSMKQNVLAKLLVTRLPQQMPTLVTAHRIYPLQDQNLNKYLNKYDYNHPV